MKQNSASVLLLFLLLVMISVKLNAAVYTTIAAGNWNSASTWQGGVVPTHNIASNDVVNINHAVTYNRPNDLVVYGTINLTNAVLQFPITGNGSGRSVTIYNTGMFIIIGSIFYMPIQDGSGNDLSGNFTLDGGRLLAVESSMDIAQNWESKNGAKANLMYSCMRMGQSHLLNGGTIDTCLYFNMEIGIHGSGNFEVSGNSIVRLANSNFLITGSGNFKVNGGSLFTGLTGYPIGLYSLKVTGSLDNDGTWSAVVQDHCLDGPIGGSNAGQVNSHLANTENCTFVNSIADGLCWLSESPLSIQLTSFQGNLDKNNKTTLFWNVADNRSINHFVVERSFNGRDFIPVATVLASEKNGAENYKYYETIIGHEKIMYRLRSVDKQNEISYSRILILRTAAPVTNDIKILGNPVTDKLIFSYTAAETHPISVHIYDMSGKLVMNTSLNTLEGENMVSLKLNSTIKAGMYVIEVSNGAERRFAKFIKN